ncbi:MAG: M20/M25/M40 family metallo-hydrolase [Deltaproteobacteria bacterium]|nr:M20/M25/M40 family metallo-hydrolase [Deltaproteobacteria bacterium]
MGAEATAFIMDQLYFGDFSILEQVSSGDAFERVNLVGRKGPPAHAIHAPPLWLVATVGTSVEPVPATWPSLEGDALAAKRSADGSRLIGLGANGGKVDLICKIAAAARFRAEELKRPIFIIALSGEEAHGSGVRSTLQMVEDSGGVALVHAPTALRFWTDHPGCLSLRLELTRRVRHRRMPPHSGFWEIRIEGRSAHALADPASAPPPPTQAKRSAGPRGDARAAAARGSEPPADDNALARGYQVLDLLRAMGDVRILSIDAGESGNRVPGRCTLRLATSFETLPSLRALGPGIEASPIQDGTALPFPIDGIFSAWHTARDAGLNAITPRLGLPRNAPAARPPLGAWTGRLVSDRDAISGWLMFWTGPGVDNGDLVDRFASAVQNALKGADEIEVGIEVLQDRVAFAGSDGLDRLGPVARRAADKSGVSRETTGGLFSSDAGLLRQHGLETLVFGPGGPISHLYRDDESIDVEAIETATHFYEMLIQQWCVEAR